MVDDGCLDDANTDPSLYIYVNVCACACAPGLVGVGEVGLGGILSESEDGHEGGHHGGTSSADLPLDPLITDGTLVGVGSVEGGVAIGEEPGNGNRLVDAAIVGLEHGEFAGHVGSTGNLSSLLGLSQPAHGVIGTSGSSNELSELGVGAPSIGTVDSVWHVKTKILNIP